MNTHQNIGLRATQEAIANGDDLYLLINELAAPGNSQALTDMLCGAIGCLLDTFDGLRTAGATPAATGDATIDAFLSAGHYQMVAAVTHSLTLRDGMADGYLSAVIAHIDDNREAVSFAEKPAPKAEAVQPQPIDLRVVLELPKAEATQPIDVRVLEMPRNESNQPIDVRVLEMPTRTTETKVRRDGNGNIASAVQTERDVR